MSALRKIKRVGKKATKFHYSATYQSVLVECHGEKWSPHMICVAWHRRGRRIMSKILPWLPSPDSPLRGLVVWPEPEVVEASITLYKGPKDKSYEPKEWEFSVIDVCPDGRRKVLASCHVDMVRYASALPFEHELQLKLKPVSRKVKKVLLEVSLSSVFLKEGKATDDDMISLASMMSVSNLSMIGNLEDDEDDFRIFAGNGRSISPEMINAAVPSTDKLIDWAQEVTNGYSGVKVINMTTSWRNGLAFCSIIHYYRPDLLDFSELSPQSIKENNRLAFDVAKELGIACPLTPDMMLLRDIPDKLAVTAFVYQMYNYFTMAVPSAIVRPTGNTPKEGGPKSSPSPLSALGSFDFSAIEKMTFKNLSPTATEGSASQRNLIGNRWSKHSLKEEQEMKEHKDQQERNEPQEEEGVVHTPEKNDNSDNPVSHSTPLSHSDKQEAGVLTTGVQSDNSTSNVLPSDQSSVTDLVPEEACLRHITPSPTGPGESSKGPESTPPNNDSSSNSLPDKEDLPHPPVSPDESKEDSRIETPTDSSDDTRTPTPNEDSTVKDSAPSSTELLDQKKEQYRRQVKEMMLNAGIRGNVATFDAISSRTRKRIQQARKGSQDTQTLRTVASSPALTPPETLHTVGEPDRQKQQLDKKTENDVLLTSQSEIQVDSNRNEDEVQTRSGLTTSQTDQTSQSSRTRFNSSPNITNKFAKDKKLLKPSKVKSTDNSPQKSSSLESAERNLRNQSSSLVILAPSSERSSAAQKMAAEPPKSETDGREETDRIEEEAESKRQEEEKEKDHEPEKERPHDVPGLVLNGSETAVAESPSAWTTHSKDLDQAILVSTSDYIKNELLLLQRDLRPLEERAVAVEKEIREAMSMGDANKEELLTVEYFKLLSEKNSMIRKQIELNLLEKEEDLEKRQFFINRELRPLAAIPEEQKTEEQKLREQQLIKELLELVDEREQLDQRLTNTTNSSMAESSSVSQEPSDSQNQVATSSLTHSIKLKFTRERPSSAQRDKDCVIC